MNDRRPAREVQVLVVGAGPAGLTAAATLARYGVSTLLVDRRAEVGAAPRATVISLRSMEIFRAMGLEAELRGGSVDVEMLAWRCRTLAEVGNGEASDVGFPSRGRAARLSPTTPLCAPQDHLERVLSRYVGALAPVVVRRGVELVDLEVGPDGVDARLSDSTQVHARYLIAADGAHSTVRSMLDIGMTVPPTELTGFTVVMRAPLWDRIGPHRYLIYSVGAPGAEGVFIPAGPDDRWVYAAETTAPDSEAAALERIRVAAGDASLSAEIHGIHRVTAVSQLAERFRHDSAFLVGDAAHRVTPRGATGMNTAVHDGFDLGWKLGWVLAGWAPPHLLDTYEAERRPVAEHNVARSADPTGSWRSAEQELRADLGGRLPHARLRDGRSTLDLLGPGLTILRRRAPGRPPPRTPDSAAMITRLVDEKASRAIGLDENGVIVRPDGKYVRTARAARIRHTAQSDAAVR
ncbi:FAD-dependent monooxygenase [Nocardia puris]|uniref:FAD-dependent monooxygenase n=1 Tax=Nocardia puris TaxID=208602 RepID=UPI001893FCDF|nr:FAD-dependent monooxygenase [Nocardia puris]MBF6210800.1 FAD-dependent monooxygenase [Nocardia puris]